MTRRDIEVLHWRSAAAASAAIAASAALLAALSGCAAGSGVQAPPTRASTHPASETSRATPARTASAAPTPSPTRTPAKPKPSALPVAPPDAGALPQTAVLPKTSSQALKNAVHDIWLAVTTGKPDYALPAFFPEKAYEQVKAIADPDSDWKNRLWYDFTLDLAAVHKLVKPGARLTGILMPTQYYQWIPAGACYNNVGYWHAPGPRVVYKEGGVTHSFGLASLISWRGDWYLIHFGAVVRSAAYGIVDDPETGPGIPGPPGNC
jgi:hypothetical protein